MLAVSWHLLRCTLPIYKLFQLSFRRYTYDPWPTLEFSFILHFWCDLICISPWTSQPVEVLVVVANGGHGGKGVAAFKQFSPSFELVFAELFTRPARTVPQKHSWQFVSVQWFPPMSLFSPENSRPYFKLQCSRPLIRPLPNYSFPKFFLCYYTPLLNKAFTSLFLYSTVPLLNCAFAGLFLYWIVPLLKCSCTELVLLYWTIYSCACF